MKRSNIYACLICLYLYGVLTEFEVHQTKSYDNLIGMNQSNVSENPLGFLLAVVY